jgi:hypothetical protein
MDAFRAPDNPPVGSATGITGVERFGVDTLVWEGARLIVRSPREMPGWRVGKNRRTAVHFRGRRYAVVAVYQEIAKHEYTLELWPERAHELPARDIHYDESYIREREDEARMRETTRRQSFGLIPLWPFLGFLPIRWKAALHLRFGVEIAGATRISLLLQLVVVMLLIVFLTITPPAPYELPVFLVLFIDLVIRGSIAFDESFPAFGFFEWMIHPELVRLLRKAWRAAGKRRKR